MTTRASLILSSLFLCLFVLPAVAQADCRDARGEPIACANPAPAEAEPPPSDEHRHRDQEQGYINFYPYLDLFDPTGVAFTPDNPGSVPEVERGSHLTNLSGGFDHALGGVSFGFGFRPTSWLRLPDVSLQWGYGDLSGANVGIEGGAQSLTGLVHDVWMLRAQIGGGVDIDFDPVRIYALGHVGIAGYFANVEVMGSTLGGLGSDTYSAASVEAGWTVGMEIELDPTISYTLGYRHIHTGIETNTVFFGTNIRF